MKLPIFLLFLQLLIILLPIIWTIIYSKYAALASDSAMTKLLSYLRNRNILLFSTGNVDPTKVERILYDIGLAEVTLNPNENIIVEHIERTETESRIPRKVRIALTALFLITILSMIGSLVTIVVLIQT